MNPHTRVFSVSLFILFAIVLSLSSVPISAEDLISKQAVSSGEGQSWKTVFDSASLLLREGKYPEAKVQLEIALALAKRLGSTSIPVGLTLSRIGSIYRHMARPDQAEQCYRQALAVWEANPGVDVLGLVRILNNLALLFIENSHYGEAERLLHRALHVRFEEVGSSEYELAKTFEYLTNVYFLRRKYGDAEIYNRKVIELCLRTFGPRHPETAIAWNDRGTLEIAMGRFPEAIEHLSMALDILQETSGQDYPGLVKILTNLGWAYQKNHQPEQAAMTLRRVVRIAEDSLDRENICLADVLSLSKYVHVLRSLGCKAEARRLQKCTEAILAVKTRKEMMSHTVDIGDLRR